MPEWGTAQISQIKVCSQALDKSIKPFLATEAADKLPPVMSRVGLEPEA